MNKFLSSGVLPSILIVPVRSIELDDQIHPQWGENQIKPVVCAPALLVQVKGQSEEPYAGRRHQCPVVVNAPCLAPALIIHCDFSLGLRGYWAAGRENKRLQR